MQSGINKAQTHQFKHVLRYLMKISVLFNILCFHQFRKKPGSLSFQETPVRSVEQGSLEITESNFFPLLFQKAAVSH